MVRAALILAAATAFLLATPSATSADDPDMAAKTFDSIYGEDLKRVLATRDAADDLDLAGRMLATARDSTRKPAFLALLCDRVYDLASPTREGGAVAIQAMELLAESVPAKAGACAERILAIRQKQFDAARGMDKLLVGESILDVLLPVAEDTAAAGNLTDAAAQYRRAAGIARAAGSIRRTEIEARSKQLALGLKTLDTVKTLKAALEKDPQDKAASEKIARLWLVDLDNPAEAATYVAGAEDPALRKYVPAAAKPVADAPEAACMELAEWYRGLGDAAPPHARAAMYARAETYLERFLDVHTDDDLDRTRGLAALEKIDAALDKADAAQWIDLLPLVDPKKNAVRGQWERQGSGLAIVRWTDFGRLMIPAVVRGNYDMKVRFARTTGGGIVGVVLPVGPTGVLLALGFQNDACHGLGEVGGKDAASNKSTVRPGKIENGRPYDVRIKIRLDGKQASVRVAIDGKYLIGWRGPASALTVGEYWRLPRPDCPGLTSYNANIVFPSVRLKTRSCMPKPPAG